MWNCHLGLAIRCSEEFEAHGGPSQVRSPRLLVPVKRESYIHGQNHGEIPQYPLVNLQKAMENHHFSIAMLNYQRVIPSNPQSSPKTTEKTIIRRPQHLGAKKTWPSRRLQRGVKTHPEPSPWPCYCAFLKPQRLEIK